MKYKKLYKFLILLFILPCIMLLGACFEEQVYITKIENDVNGNYVVKYSNGTSSVLETTSIIIDLDTLKDVWETEHSNNESFSEYLMENAHLVVSYNIGVNELKEAWQNDFYNGFTTKTFSEFLAAFANIGEGYNLTESINKTLFNCVSVYCKFNYTVTNPLTGVPTQETKSGAGSGVIYKLDKVNKEAYIITNYHVVYDSDDSRKISDNIKICVYGNENFLEGSKSAVSATFVGGSSTYDIAVLKIDATNENSNVIFDSNCKAAVIEDSNNVFVGDEVYAIGNAQGYGISAVSGVISVDSEQVEINANTQERIREIRITAPVNPGNSGGGLFNEKGKLVGIVNAKIVSESVEGIAYAIPFNVAKAIVNNIIKTCNGITKTKVSVVRVGLTIHTTNSSAVFDESINRTKIIEQVSVYAVSENSLAFNTNLQVGDVINSANIKQTASSDAMQIDVTRQHILIDAILSCFEGGSLQLNVTHLNGTQETVTIVFSEGCAVEID